MRVVTDTTNHEKGFGLVVLAWQKPEDGFLPRIGVRGDVPSQE